MSRAEDAAHISLQVSRGIVVASIQTDLEPDVLAGFQRDVLQRIHDVGARGLVLEMSGLETLDPAEFEALRRVISMARIMGTETVLVGLSAGIVSALVTSDVDVDGLRATLGIDEALALFEQEETPVGPDDTAADPEPEDEALRSAPEAEA